MFYKNCFETLFLSPFRRYKCIRRHTPGAKGRYAWGTWAWASGPRFLPEINKISFCQSTVFFSWSFIPLIGSQGVFFPLGKVGFWKLNYFEKYDQILPVDSVCCILLGASVGVDKGSYFLPDLKPLNDCDCNWRLLFFSALTFRATTFYHFSFYLSHF